MSANNKFLGIAAIAASPFLGLEMSTNGSENTSWGAFFGLIYMLGWMCGVIALMQMKAAGEKLTGRIVLFIQLLLLCISNIWNVWAIIDPANSSTLFFMIGFSGL